MSRSHNNQSQPFESVIYPITLIVISLVALVITFVLANSVREYSAKLQGFIAVILGYLFICFAVHYWGSRYGDGDETAAGELAADGRLFEIEEAGEYFGGSMKSADMFRLVMNKVSQILTFNACILYLVDHAKGCVRIVQSTGVKAEPLKNVETDLDAGLAGRCALTKLVQIDRGIIASKEPVPSDAIRGFRSSAAIPLIRDGEVFAVLQFFSESLTAFDGNSVTILEAVGERVSPLILSSMSFERSLTNALTDPVTDLPNERAFHLILENQIAEAQRRRDERPLTIMAIDIRGFDELNGKYGHSTGDRVLGMVAHEVKGQLRQMDFLARSSNDEFLAILPTASEEVAEEVITRINNALFASRLFVNETESINPELNFGAAFFGKHGESAEPLIKAARLRKQQAKSDEPHKVLWFPQDIVN